MKEYHIIRKMSSEFEIPIGSLEEQALKRKERLRNLKRKAEEKSSGIQQTDDKAGNKQLQSAVQLLSKSTEKNANNEGEVEIVLKNDDVISKMTSEMDKMKIPIVIDEIDIQNLAPRKPDWDLKRDVAKKMEILDRRTQRAIAEIIRERLQSNRGEVDLQAVNAVGYTANPTES